MVRKLGLWGNKGSHLMYSRNLSEQGVTQSLDLAFLYVCIFQLSDSHLFLS